MDTRILVIGGIDPGGCAGLDADRDAARFCGVGAICVVSARTDQDDHELRSVGEVDPAIWLAEARAAGDVHAVKLGLLPSVAAVRAAAELSRELRAARAAGGPAVPVVLDPILATSSGYTFLDERAVAVLVEELVPVVDVVTPNLEEAAAMTGRPVATPEERVAAAERLLSRGARAVILKGGHGDEDPLRDLVLAAGAAPLWIENPRVEGTLRGTGCRYATALAAGLARGEDLERAAHDAARFVASRIAAAGTCVRSGAR